jgi:hypothetical protein
MYNMFLQNYDDYQHSRCDRRTNLMSAGCSSSHVILPRALSSVELLRVSLLEWSDILPFLVVGLFLFILGKFLPHIEYMLVLIYVTSVWKLAFSVTCVRICTCVSVCMRASVHVCVHTCVPRCVCARVRMYVSE